jgi:5-methylcytosine-specific restriction endonuclease McrA
VAEAGSLEVLTLSKPFMMRQSCPACTSPFGYVERRNGQACVFCSACERWVYNAPRTETGERQRSLTTIHGGVKPKVRAAILLRSNGRCEICGADLAETDWHVGHLVSVKDGLAEGLTDAEVNHQENLCALCAECNSGIGDQSVTLRMILRIALRRRVMRATA